MLLCTSSFEKYYMRFSLFVNPHALLYSSTRADFVTVHGQACN